MFSGALEKPEFTDISDTSDVKQLIKQFQQTCQPNTTNVFFPETGERLPNFAEKQPIIGLG